MSNHPIVQASLDGDSATFLRLAQEINEGVFSKSDRANFVELANYADYYADVRSRQSVAVFVLRSATDTCKMNRIIMGNFFLEYRYVIGREDQYVLYEGRPGAANDEEIARSRS